MARALKANRSLLFAVQDGGYSVEKTTGFVALPVGQDVTVDLGRDKEDFQRLEGQVGAESEPLIGGKHGSKVAFRIPLRAGAAAEWGLLGTLLGSKTANAAEAQAEVLADMAAGGSATSFKTDVTVLVAGILAVARNATTYALTQIGWVKSVSTTTATLLEGSVATDGSTPLVAGATNDLAPTDTYYLSTTECAPRTVREVGNAATDGTVLVGWIPEEASLTIAARKPLIIDFAGSATSHLADNTIGGLTIPTEYPDLPPVIGAHNSRQILCVAETADSGYPVAVSDGAPVHSITNCKLEIKNPLIFEESPAGDQGVYDAKPAGRTFMVTLAVPYDSADPVYDSAGAVQASGKGLAKWISYFERRVKLRMSLYVGAKCFDSVTNTGGGISILCPSLRIAEQPKREWIDGQLYWSLVLKPAPYVAAGASASVVDADPADSLLRIARF